MPGGFVPRFSIEAGFLILLGVGAGIADLRTAVIVMLLAGAWLVVTLIELAAWRAEARPVGVSIPPPPAFDADGEAEPEWSSDEPTPEFEEADYPLRADSAAPSEEVEAYTRILGARGEDDLPGEAAE
jgi:hypothetical protein